MERRCLLQSLEDREARLVSAEVGEGSVTAGDGHGQ
jgi:hypothetical protein